MGVPSRANAEDAEGKGNVIPDVIWIVERVRDEHYGASTHVVSWHVSRVEAEEMATRLQAEFDQACERAWPWHEAVDTIFEMLHEHEYVKHAWIDCDREECGYFERHHQHHTERILEEHEASMIEQLTDWWHQESLAWQIFVEDEILAKMTDPPRYCQELVRHLDDETVHYECHAVGREPAVTLAGYAERAQQSTSRYEKGAS